MQVGDLVKWSKGHCEAPGLVLEAKSALGTYTDRIFISGFGPGTAVLALLPELSEPEWFHEKELEVISESR